MVWIVFFFYGLIMESKVNIGDKVEYENEYGENCNGSIVNILSDMDSYEDMRLIDGIPLYASKKLTASENKRRKKKGMSSLKEPVYAPVKPKNIDSVFVEVFKSENVSNEFIRFSVLA